MQTQPGYVINAIGRGLQSWRGSLTGGVLGGVGAVAVNWVRNSDQISIISRNLPGLANRQVALLVGGILPAVGGLLGKVAIPHKIRINQKFDLYEILGMTASIPVAKYLTKSTWSEASVYGGIGIAIALGIKFLPRERPKNQVFHQPD